MQNGAHSYGIQLDDIWPGSSEQRRLENALLPLLKQDLLRFDSAAELMQHVQVALLKALAPSELVIVLWNSVLAQWVLLPSRVALLTHAYLTSSQRLSTLEQVRFTGTAALRPAASPQQGLFSLLDGTLEYSIAVPFFWWAKSGAVSERSLAGCFLCSYHSENKTDSEAVLTMLSQVVQAIEPALNALKLLRSGSPAPSVEPSGRVSADVPSAPVFSVEGVTTRDETFHRTVLLPLHKASQARNVNILLRGATGSGKTWLAELTHRMGHRRDRPFVVLDCSQITSAETLGAELFGYASESGYHNSPRQGRPGKARLADTGTLFLDEIGCLPPELQQKLLRLIEKGRFSPLGSGEEVSVDVQIIAATNADLETYVSQRLFREDLMWRLNEVVIRVPALSEHSGDIPELAMTFLQGARQRLNRPELEAFSPEAIHELQCFPWEQAGNVRGLQHTIQRSVLLSPVGSHRLDVEHLRFPSPAISPEVAVTPKPPKRLSSRPSAPGQEGGPELQDIVAAIRQCGYATEAARMLGISHRQLTWQLQRAGTTVREILTKGRG